MFKVHNREVEKMNAKATLYLDAKLYKAAKIKAAHTEQSVSEIVNEALRLSLKEDSVEIEAVQNRTHEPVRSYGQVLKDLKRERLI